MEKFFKRSVFREIVRAIRLTSTNSLPTEKSIVPISWSIIVALNPYLFAYRGKNIFQIFSKNKKKKWEEVHALLFIDYLPVDLKNLLEIP